MVQQQVPPPLTALQDWMRLNVVAERVKDLRKSGNDIQRQDFYAFRSPRVDRPLSVERIAIIATTIGVTFEVAYADYISRGGKLALSRRTA